MEGKTEKRRVLTPKWKNCHKDKNSRRKAIVTLSVSRCRRRLLKGELRAKIRVMWYGGGVQHWIAEAVGSVWGWRRSSSQYDGRPGKVYEILQVQIMCIFAWFWTPVYCFTHPLKSESDHHQSQINVRQLDSSIDDSNSLLMCCQFWDGEQFYPRVSWLSNCQR